MSEPVERMALAIADDVDSEGCAFRFSPASHNPCPPKHCGCRRQARAALKTLRDPTEAMLNAARDWSYAKYGKPIGNDAAIGCFQAMLDAALK